MSTQPPSDSVYLLDGELAEKRSVGALKSLLLVLLVLQLLLGVVLGTSLVIDTSIVHASSPVQFAVLGTVILLTGISYSLLRAGHYVWAGHVLVYSLIVGSAVSMAAYGSARSAMVMGFAGAIISAGMALGKKSLMLAVVLSGAALGLVTLAEWAGWLPKPNLGVGLSFWLVHMLVLTAIAFSVYTSRQVVLRALREQQAELRRREDAENQLRLSEDRYTRIFRSTPAAIVVQTVDDLTVLDVNPAFERLYGYSRQEFIGGTDARLWNDPEQRAAFGRQMAVSGAVINMPLDARTKDGRQIHILLSCKVEGARTARIVVSTITDATAETRAREAARKSEELFEKAFAFSPINMNITRARDGVFLASNGAASMVQGYRAEELVGRNSLDAGTWPSQEARERFVAKLRESQSVHAYETQMLSKQGQMVDCLLWAVFVEIDGEECILSAVINVTEQKRREAVLLDLAQGLSSEAGEPFFRSVVQHLGKAIGADMVMVGEINPDRSITSLALELDHKLMPNMSYAMAGTPCDVAAGSADLCVYGEGAQRLFPEDSMLADLGLEAYIGVCLRDGDGTPIGILNASWRQAQAPSADRDALVRIFASRTHAELLRLRRDREIQTLNETLEKRVNERTDQLKATNAELESFGYSVSHDLQSPLRSIEGFSVLLARRLKGRLSEEEERLFDRVRVNVVRMHELINDLLALARVSKGQLRLEQVNLSELAQQVIAEEQLRDPQRQVRVSIQPGIEVRCDAKFARIILENLIGNAWKYSRSRTDAHIEFGSLPTRDGGRKMLFVRDNGAGFNMAYSDSLFKPFHRLHHDNEFEGSGIGLATVHRILERHGGVIRGESAEGAGACFYFSFEPRFGAISA